MTDFEYAVFDMDGTLLTSMGYWRNSVYELYQIKDKDDEDVNYWDSLPVLKAIALANEKFNKNYSITDILTVMEPHYRNDINFKGEAESLLYYLKGQGIKMCLITATPQPLAKKVVEMFSLERFFSPENIYTPAEFPKGKRDPNTFIKALANLGGVPQKSALFEDAYYSMQTGKSLDMKIYAVEDESQSQNKEKIKEICDYYFDSLPAKI
ncbi:MAG: HAD family phosphatase [Acutalibacteraceae bacterium]|nr:HAD family phosphatase [Acutalibacteraceae bacterium]